MVEKVVEMPKVEENKLTVGNSDLEFLVSQGALRQLTSSRDLPLPITDSFALEKLVDQILVLHDGAYNREKRKLIEKYADRGINGKLYESQPGHFQFKNKMGLFQRDFDELLKLESTINGTKIKINVTDIPPKLLSIDDIKALRCIIDFTITDSTKENITNGQS